MLITQLALSLKRKIFNTMSNAFPISCNATINITVNVYFLAITYAIANEC